MNFTLSACVLFRKYLVNVFNIEFWTSLSRFCMFEIDAADLISRFSILFLRHWWILLLILIRLIAFVIKFRYITLIIIVLYLRCWAIFSIFHCLPKLQGCHAFLSNFIEFLILICRLNVFSKWTRLAWCFLFMSFPFSWVVYIIFNSLRNRCCTILYFLPVLILQQRLNHDILSGISDLRPQSFHFLIDFNWLFHLYFSFLLYNIICQF